MLEKFSASIYENVVEDGMRDYMNMYNKISTANTIEYWKEARSLYNSLDSNHKEVFFAILKQTMIDTIATTFYCMDAGMNIGNEELECDIEINGENTNHSMKDYFLWKVDELQSIK